MSASFTSGDTGLMIKGTGNLEGYAVAGIGDLNEDGLDDVIIGDKKRTVNRAVVVYGSATKAKIDIISLAETEGFGLTHTDTYRFWRN